MSQLKIVTMAMISNPPIHAAQLVIEILSNEALRKQWFEETKLMADRIKSMSTLSTITILTARNCFEKGS
jgi:aspartate/tyrosine/aromatic aminotransferase